MLRHRLCRPEVHRRPAPPAGAPGSVRTTQNFMGMTMQSTTACPKCGGTGKIIKDPCPTCRGKGKVRRSTKIRVQIPAGVDDGQTVRVRGRAALAPTEGPAATCWWRFPSGATPSSSETGQMYCASFPLPSPRRLWGRSWRSPPWTGRFAIPFPRAPRPARSSAFGARASPLSTARPGEINCHRGGGNAHEAVPGAEGASPPLWREHQGCGVQPKSQVLRKAEAVF